MTTLAWFLVVGFFGLFGLERWHRRLVEAERDRLRRVVADLSERAARAEVRAICNGR